SPRKNRVRGADFSGGDSSAAALGVECVGGAASGVATPNEWRSGAAPGSARASGSFDHPQLAALAAAAEKTPLSVAFQTRNEDPGGQLELLEHLARLAIDASNFAAVVLLRRVPQLTLAEADAGHEAIGDHFAFTLPVSGSSSRILRSPYWPTQSEPSAQAIPEAP